MVKSYPAFLALFAAAASTVSASGQTRYAALKLFQDVGAPGDDSATSISRLVGFVNKHEANPLFTQDVDWEPRLDNAYPNTIFDAATNTYQVFYGNCISSPGLGAPDCSEQTLHYANSTDGLVWEKPDLGLFDLADKDWVRDDLKVYGTHNNIIMQDGGVGVYDDVEQTGPEDECRYKAFGEGQFKGTTDDNADGGSQTNGISCSADGLNWVDGQTLSFPDPQRYDTHNNVYYHTELDQYLYTTRAGFDDAPGRCVGQALGTDGEFSKYDVDFDGFGTVESGANDAQIYAQLPFPFLDMYLAYSMVYDAESDDGLVHTLLSYSFDGVSGWDFVENLYGTDFIPLGPGLGLDVHDPSNAFDSHVIFASTGQAPAGPMLDEDGLARVYYMGGNGPHSGTRNTSFGLATLPSVDRFAGVGGTGTIKSTITVLVTGPTLTVTADSLAYGDAATLKGAAVTVATDNIVGLMVTDATPLSLRSTNATDAPVTFAGVADFSDYVGKEVSIVVELVDALVYSVGFV